MNVLALTVLLFGLPLALASDVFDYTDADFKDKIKTHDVALVEFYAPWCGHCKKLAPEYEKAATSLKKSDIPVALVKVDCVGEGKATCDKHGVSGFPTLKIFRNGEIASDYEGPREADGIVKYMRTKAGPVSKEITTEQEVEKMISGEENVVIGFFSDMSSTAGKEFMKIAGSESEKFRFAHVTNKALADKYKHSEVIVMFRSKKFQNKFESNEEVYSGSISLPEVKKWLSANMNGLVGLRTASNAGDFAKPTVVVYYKIDLIKDPKGFSYWRNRVLKLAKSFKDAKKEVTFAVSSVEEMSHELAEFGLESKTSSDKPVATARDAEGKKYRMDADWSIEALEKFVNDLLAGKLEAHLKSEAIPEQSADEHVKIVVAKNFDEIVNDNTKDVLIEFYAPWCGHCKSLAPKYEELATKLKDEKNIVIAKMDATANDVPSTYKVQGFPTIFFAPKNSKSNPKQFNGGREVKDFVQYLAKEATEEMSGFDRSGKVKKAKKDKIEL